MKIHASESVYMALDPDVYVCEHRGNINVKGKGVMRTYWVLGKQGSALPVRPGCKFSIVSMAESRDASPGMANLTIEESYDTE